MANNFSGDNSPLVLRFLINTFMASRSFHPMLSYPAEPVYHADMPHHKKNAVLDYPIMDISCSAGLNLSDISLYP